MQDRVVIVGTGHGGVQAAASLRQEGFEGEVVLLGEEREVPYHKPPLSKTFLKAPDSAAQVLRAERFYGDNRIDFRPGTRVEEIDRQAGCVRLAGGESLSFSHLVLATGARPRLPEIAGVALDGVHALRNMADARALRAASAEAASAAIVGGGYIGMEIAHTLAALGKEVTLLEAAPRVLGRSVAPAVSAHLHRRAVDAGIEIVTRAEVTAIEGAGGRAAAVALADGRRVAAELVVLGTGILPNVEIAAAAGLKVDNGIVVDQSMRTADPRILAIGDVAAYRHWHAGRQVRLESVQNATDQARHAARAILGGSCAYREVPWFWSDQGDVKLQTAGLSFAADRFVIAGEPEENAFSVYHFAGTRLLAVDSLNRPADHMIARRILAAGIAVSEEDIAAGRERMKDLLTQRQPEAAAR